MLRLDWVNTQLSINVNVIFVVDNVDILQVLYVYVVM